MLFFPVLLVFVFLAFVAQHFLPSLPNDARIYLMPLLVFYSAVTMPFWMMLVVAFASGWMWDAFNAQVLDAGVEISIGSSILLYAIFGAIMSGFRPVFQRGRWDVYVLASFLCGVFTAVIAIAEFAMICFRRNGFFFTKELGWRVAGSGLAATAIAPALFVFLNIVARLCGYEPRAARRDE
jgi:rod shape-determining protein MreD